MNALNIFLRSMKWKALIAFWVLLTPVLVPAAQSMLDIEAVSILLIDEEKGKEDKASKIFSPIEEHLIPGDLYFHNGVMETRAEFRGGTLTNPFSKRHLQPPDFS